MAGHMLTRGPKAFEEVPQLSGFMKPCRYEGEVRNLEVIGQIPKEINGTFYRVMPDPQFPSRFSNDPVSQSSEPYFLKKETIIHKSGLVVQWRWKRQCISF